MDKGYIELFKTIARGVELTSETAMDDKMYREKAERMRDDYIKLVNKLDEENVELSLADYVKLYFGAEILTKQIERNIATWRLTAENYRNGVIPKLRQVIDAKENFKEIAEKNFNLNN